ncbi:MAG: hypothetical protein JSW04_02895 [Desulfobacterales bacterium]|nr:MAG: hypothetical protein JSW04_02895 [Desulfobacterales bacterium]
MRQKKLTLIVTVIMLFSFVTVSSAHAVIDLVALAVVGFSALAALIVGDKAIENHNNSMAKQVAPVQKTKGKLQATRDAVE